MEKVRKSQGISTVQKRIGRWGREQGGGEEEKRKTILTEPNNKKIGVVSIMRKKSPTSPKKNRGGGKRRRVGEILSKKRGESTTPRGPKSRKGKKERGKEKKACRKEDIRYGGKDTIWAGQLSFALYDVEKKKKGFVDIGRRRLRMHSKEREFMNTLEGGRQKVGSGRT